MACVFQSSIAVTSGLTRVLAISLMPPAPCVTYLASGRTKEDKYIESAAKKVEQWSGRQTQKSQKRLEEGALDSIVYRAMIP